MDLKKIFCGAYLSILCTTSFAKVQNVSSIMGHAPMITFKVEIGGQMYEYKGYQVYNRGAETNKLSRGGFVGPQVSIDAARSHDDRLILNEGIVIGPNARVFGYARIGDGVKILDQAQISGNARVIGKSVVSGHAIVRGHAVVKDSEVSGYAEVFDYAQIFDDSSVREEAKVFGFAQVFSNARVGGDEEFSGNDRVKGQSKPSFFASIFSCCSGDTFTSNSGEGLMLSEQWVNKR